MNLLGKRRSSELAAVLIAPGRDLADQFSLTLAESRSFQILADLKKYPAPQALEIRLRQLKPEVVLLDLSTNVEAAGELIRFMTSFRPAVHVIGLHRSNDPEVALHALRLGASEFLFAPFDPAVQREAVAGIQRLRKPESGTDTEPSRLVAFSSAKPGSGASTLACQTALVLRQVTGQRVLLVDVDLTGGTVAFYLRLKHSHSLLNVLETSEHLEAAHWASLTADCRGVDVLPAPGVPRDAVVDPDRFRQFLEQMRRIYDWVILDLPAIFNRVSLLALAECDCTFLVSTPELPSLHLARKAVNLLAQLGIGKDRLKVLVNRVSKGGGMSGADLEKIFNCPVQRCFPNDYVSLHRVVAMGEPLNGCSSLGKAIEDFAGRLAGTARSEKRGARLLLDASPAFAGT
jgi:pilus assembly protein CpaE